jgi:hypothetical protein
MNVDIYVDEQLTAFPQIYCAHCGETITDASDANLIFKETYGKRSAIIKGTIHTVHKCCDRPFTLLTQERAAAQLTIGGCAVSIRGLTVLFDGRHLGGNRIHRFDQFFMFGLLGSFASFTWPDVETAVVNGPNFPGAPNSFAFAKATVKNIMCADVALGSVAFKAGGIVTALDEKVANVIQPITAHQTVGELEMELHSVPAASWKIIVKATPRP